MFGERILATVVLQNGSAVTCKTPVTAKAGRVSVRIWVNNSQAGNKVTGPAELFEYGEPWEVHSVRPTAGTVSGGTFVEVAGSGFVPNSTKCLFGSTHVPASDVDVMSSELLKCRSPAGVEGEAVVEVSANGQDYTRNGIGFRYIADAVITELVPSTGPVNGGTVVTVVGLRFANVATLMCKLGKSFSTRSAWRSSSLVECVTGAHRSANVSLDCASQTWQH
jgi:hypothetical protein